MNACKNEGEGLNRHILLIVTYNRSAMLAECIRAAKQQSVPYSKIVIVDNASTDGTASVLKPYKADPQILILREKHNVGGAGGFADGLREVLKLEADWITLIDDDAILSPDFLKVISQGIQEWKGKAQAFAGVPLTNGLRIGHRRRLTGRRVVREVPVPAEEYREKYFCCQIASFCGLVLSVDLIRRIGLPIREYFIWYDDTEYCLRIRPFSPIVNCNEAVIDHRAAAANTSYTIGWKEYYGIRNRIDMCRRQYGKATAYYVAFRKLGKGLLQSGRALVREGFPAGRKNWHIYRDGIRDGLRGRLGLRSPYLPGK